MRFEKLFQPIRIGSLTVRNRIECAPMTAFKTTPEGYPTRELIEFYKVKARGGAGIVTLGEACIDNDRSATMPNHLNMGSDAVIGAMTLVAEAIKRYGARASCEINHAGIQTIPELIGGRTPIGPSPIVSSDSLWVSAVPHQTVEMTKDMIDEVVEHYADAALRAKAAGFDMLMLHGGHGWLLDAFLSPYTNKRTDEYGGSLENRARFPLQVIDRVRQTVGDFPIEYRFSAEELVPGGLTLDETVRFARMIESKVDMLHVSCGIHNEAATFYQMHAPCYLPHAINADRAAKIKEAVSIPVNVVGSITDPAMAEEILRSGKADMVAAARMFVADPDWPNKALRGQSEDIRPCTRCFECFNPSPAFHCTVNPVAGREMEYDHLAPPLRKKKVVVVGGGPGGMQAAITAASRGHEVTLFEKDSQLGGVLNVGTVPTFKDDLKAYRDYLVRKVNSLPVTVKLGAAADAAAVAAAQPDAVFLSVGADPVRPAIPGIDRPNVGWAGDLWAGKFAAGQKVVVAGGGHLGLETALYLVRQGKQVTVVEMTDSVGALVPFPTRNALLDLLEAAGVQLRTGEKITEFLDGGVRVVDKQGQSRIVEGDSAVLALGMKPRAATVDGLKTVASEVYVIGDCASPRKVVDAVREGFVFAAEL